MAIGLMDIHKVGVVHLDTHPANYNYDEDGYPILIDFGCAQTGITKPDSGGVNHYIGYIGCTETVPEMTNKPKKFGYMAEWFLFGHYIYSALSGKQLMEQNLKQ